MLDALLILAGLAVLAALLYHRSTRSFTDDSGARPALSLAARRAGMPLAPPQTAIARIPTPALCACAMATAFAQMDARGPIPAQKLLAAARRRLSLDAQTAEDHLTLAFWLVEQGGGPTPAFAALTTRLKQLDHGPQFDQLMALLGDITAAGSKGMPSPAQADAMGALARVFRTA